MTERPILFSSTMVRAILEGRKNATRRILKLPPAPNHFKKYEAELWSAAVGDHLWVRETWAQDMEGEIFWKADHINMPSTIKKWKPSIFMPRRASRITLEITDIRVEPIAQKEWYLWVIEFRRIK